MLKKLVLYLATNFNGFVKMLSVWRLKNIFGSNLVNKSLLLYL
jgi:hypothetical protein